MKERDRPVWFPFYLNDWRAGTRGMSLVERAVYLEMLLEHYENRSGVPSDPRAIARIVNGTVEDVTAALEYVAQKWETQGDRLVHRRVLEEHAKRDALRAKRRNAANARWGERSIDEEQTDAHAMHVQSTSKAPVMQNDASHSHSHSHRTQGTTSTVEEQTFDVPRARARDATATKRGSRFAIDECPDEWERFATQHTHEHGVTWTRDRIRKEFDRFRDYWQSMPGQRGVRLDWLATWRNWVRKSVEETAAPRRPNASQRPATRSMLEFGQRSMIDDTPNDR